MSAHRRPPISARHAFALAFDLAVRRDALQSLVVPLLVRLPWILAPVLVARLLPALPQDRSLLLKAAGELLDFLTFVIVTAMLRERARSVFNTTSGTHPAPVRACYARSLNRVPALYLTEALRNGLFTLTLPLVFPALWVAFKFSFATETVVLRRLNPFKASVHSFQLTEGRFERWLEMIVMTVLLIVPIWFLVALCYLTVPGGSVDLWYTVAKLGTAAFIPLVQYAWTFFYLRLEEVAAVSPVETGHAQVAEVPPPERRWQAAAGRQPHLRLVDLRPEADEPPETPND